MYYSQKNYEGTKITYDMFCDCTNTKSITIPNSVEKIGDFAFAECSNLTSITIPNSVTSIGDGAFYYCFNLKTITIPDSVETIGENAFWKCSSLESITITYSGEEPNKDAKSVYEIKLKNASINPDATFKWCAITK